MIVTRKLQTNDSGTMMAYYRSLVYLVITILLALLPAIVGELSNTHPSIAFLLRAWRILTFVDWVIMSGLGWIWAGWMYLISRAYSLAQASVVAPFEYVSLPINIMWGFLIWREIPIWMTLAGAFLRSLAGHMFYIGNESN